MGSLYNDIEPYDKEIDDINEKILKLKNTITELTYKKDEQLRKKVNTTLIRYSNADDRRKILEEAKNLGYSEKEMQRFEILFNNWNQDNITNEDVDELVEIEKYINLKKSVNNEAEITQRKNLCTKIGNFFSRYKEEEL